MSLDRTDETSEHVDTDGCCECGSREHVCFDCPTFTDADVDDLVPLRLHERGPFLLSGNQTCTCGWVGHGKRGERIETLAGELSNHAEIPVRDSAFGYCRDCDAPITVEGSRVCSYCAALKLGF